MVGLHFLAALLLMTGSIRMERIRAAAPLSLLWLPRENPAKTPLNPAAAFPERKKREATPDSAAPPDAAAPPGVAEPEPSNAITLPLDLGAEADAAARRQSDLEENERRWRNLAGPSESQLRRSRNNAPLIRDYHQKGDSERAEGGELIAWMGSKCYFTTHGITTMGLPETSMVCKDPPKPETELFKDMRKQLDEAAKGPVP